jgi:DNA-binding response OmpR family regulator
VSRILLIEDDVDLTVVISRWLEHENHTMEVVHNGREGLERLRAAECDVVVLDWDLPEMEGIDVLRIFRDEGGITPVIMLTGKRAEDEKVLGLELADDYLTKPFHINELSARIRSLHRRATM